MNPVPEGRVVKARSKAQQLRLLIDKLEKAAREATAALDGLDDLKVTAKAAKLLGKTPEGILSWRNVLTAAYQAAKKEQNAPTKPELALYQKIEAAKKARDEALAAYREVVKQCDHRIKLEDPTINETNGAAIYPDHPTCLVCDEEFEFDWYCEQSPELTCQYPNVLGNGPAHFIRGEDLMSANHDGDIECVHCGQTWTRMR